MPRSQNDAHFIFTACDLKWIMTGTGIGLGVALCILVAIIIIVRKKSAMKNSQNIREGNVCYYFMPAIDFCNHTYIDTMYLNYVLFRIGNR